MFIEVKTASGPCLINVMNISYITAHTGPDEIGTEIMFADGLSKLLISEPYARVSTLVSTQTKIMLALAGSKP